MIVLAIVLGFKHMHLFALWRLRVLLGSPTLVVTRALSATKRVLLAIPVHEHAVHQPGVEGDHAVQGESHYVSSAGHSGQHGRPCSQTAATADGPCSQTAAIAGRWRARAHPGSFFILARKSRPNLLVPARATSSSSRTHVPTSFMPVGWCVTCQYMSPYGFTGCFPRRGT